MEITYTVVKELLEKHGYYTTDKIIWDTINNINKLVKGNKKGQDIHAVCLEGMPGSGKTFYAETYQKVLQDILSENVEMIDFQCDATTGKSELNEEINVASAIAGNPDNVIIEGKLVKAIKAVNSGKKVILFLDEFEKAREDTDTYLYQFLQKGKINTVQLGDLEIDGDKKKNLQVILCKNYFRLHLSEPLERRLKFMRLEPMKPEIFYNVANRELPECDKTLIAIVSILYEEIHKNKEYFKRVPSCSELLDAINDANDIIDIAPDKYILDAILSNMIKTPEDFEVFENMVQNNKKLKEIANLLNQDSIETTSKRTQLQYAILEDFFSDDIKRLSEELKKASEDLEILKQSNMEKDKKLQEQSEILENIAFEQRPETDENQQTQLPETIKISEDYEVYHSNNLNEQPSNIQSDLLKRYRIDKSVFDYSDCEWNEIGSFELPNAREEDTYISNRILTDLDSSIICRDGYLVENDSDFKVLIYKVKDGKTHRYRIFADKLVLTEKEIKNITKAIDIIYYSSHNNSKEGNASSFKFSHLYANNNISFNFLVVCDEPKKQINEDDVKIKYQQIDKNIYNVFVRDIKNNASYCGDNLKDVLGISKDDKISSKNYAQIALNKHYELIHKNLILRAKEQMASKKSEQNSKKEIENTAINRATNNSGESTQKTLFRKLFDIWR